MPPEDHPNVRHGFFALAVTTREFCSFASEGEVSPVAVQNNLFGQCFHAKGCVLGGPSESFQKSRTLFHAFREPQNTAQCLILGRCWGTLSPVLEGGAERCCQISSERRDTVHDVNARSFAIHVNYYQLDGFAFPVSHS